MPDLEGRVAIITGGSRGIGAATAELLVRCGAKVAGAGGHRSAAEPAGAGRGGRRPDQRGKEEDLQRLLDSALER